MAHLRSALTWPFPRSRAPSRAMRAHVRMHTQRTPNAHPMHIQVVTFAAPAAAGAGDGGMIMGLAIGFAGGVEVGSVDGGANGPVASQNMSDTQNGQDPHPLVTLTSGLDAWFQPHGAGGGA